MSFVPAHAVRPLERALGTRGPPLEVIARGVRELGLEETVAHLDAPFSFWLDLGELTVAARDPFGLAPLAYRVRDARFSLSAAELDEGLDLASVVDFARFGWLPRVERTLFAGVFCVPPGHTATVKAGDISVAPYPFGPPEDVSGEAHEIVERFVALLGDACVARASDDNAVLLSGGLDSTLVAALLKERGVKTRAVTVESAAHGVELPLARAVSAHLDLAHDVILTDDHGLLSGWENPRRRASLPREHPRGVTDAALAIGETSFVGDGGDPLLTLPPDIAKKRPLPEVLWSRFVHGLKVPVRDRLAATRTRGPLPEVPKWLRPEIAAEGELSIGREKLLFDVPAHARQSGFRADGIFLMQAATWARQTEGAFDGAHGRKIAHPFFDRAVARFVLSLPYLPWTAEKALLRAALRGRVPRVIRERVKTPVRRKVRLPFDLRGLTALRDHLRSDACRSVLSIEQIDRMLDTNRRVTLSELRDELPAWALANFLFERETSKR